MTKTDTLTAPLLKRQNAQRLEQIEPQMAAIEAEILRQIHADADLSRRFAILASIPGVSAVTAFALLIEMPELGVLDAGQAASLAGLPRSPGSPADGPDTPSSEEDEPPVEPSTCRRLRSMNWTPFVGPRGVGFKV